MDNWWQKVYFGNSLQDWITAIGVILVGFILLRIIKKTVLSWLKKWASRTATSIDDFLVGGVEKSIFPLLYVFFVYTGIGFLTIPEKWSHRISAALWVVVMFFILRIVTSGVRFFIFSALKEKDNSDVRQKQAGGLIVILNFCIYVIGFIFLLDNLGYNMGTLIAGLGIGGIAIALAAQTILGDLFSYFVIFFDKPFEVGDFIIVDDKLGVIEYIGIKTTRVRNLGGEQIVFSNKDLTNSRLHNFGRMEKRRVVFKIGVVYQTPAEKIKMIPELVKNIILKQEDITFDRGHFMNFGNSSLDFEFVYYILSADYTTYMNKHQAILLDIFEAFEKENIDFAYPTQTLFIEGQKAGSDNKVSTKSEDALTRN